ncbi:hypothetical protein F751_6720 [Auxenochlorella protothecoides]|uniref:Uncharacterized protein n=1 Tax=Auxenochlorella protothecoides TaxID=3075 RepID=A0A087SAD5_AUXPR|nr:hypothetical protein F751_6720 [Auxenochlorella protothecoides]KFM22689.1 hypothetical protein F751_6720 [Auxenochlorella protothecoides]
MSTLLCKACSFSSTPQHGDFGALGPTSHQRHRLAANEGPWPCSVRWPLTVDVEISSCEHKLSHCRGHHSRRARQCDPMLAPIARPILPPPLLGSLHQASQSQSSQPGEVSIARLTLAMQRSLVPSHLVFPGHAFSACLTSSVVRYMSASSGCRIPAMNRGTVAACELPPGTPPYTCST